MSQKDNGKNDSQKDVEKNKRTFEHETDKSGQRQGGIDKKGEKEKDKKGEF